MSLCQICKQREATVYFTQIINGVKPKCLFAISVQVPTDKN